jgi:RimJ/RimL family protein N-acetyltransferase
MALSTGNLFIGVLLRFAAPQPDDAEIMARWSSDSEYARLVDSDFARPRSTRFFTKQDPDENSNTGIEFRLRTVTDDRLIGFVALHSIEWNNQVGLLSIGIGDRDYWGKGYGSDALRMMLRYGFYELNLHRIGLNVFSYNQRAIRAYEKVGFVVEGVQREFLNRDGQRYDLVWMGILRQEWLSFNNPR